MKQWYDVIKYRLSLYLASSKIVVPTVVFIVFTYITYKHKPCVFIPDAQTSAILAGAIMMCITFTFLENEDVVAESILFCNVNRNKATYYGSKLVSLFCISIFFSLLGTIYPFIVNAFNNFELFNREITLGDFIGSLVLHLIMSNIFISVMFLLQPRNLKDRKMAVILSILVAVLTISKSGIIESNEMWRYVMWVLPPVNNIIGYFKGGDVFTINSLLVGGLYRVGYSVIVFIIGIIMVDKKIFKGGMQMEKKLKEEKTNINLTQEQATKKRMKRATSIFLIILSASLFVMTIIFTNDRINETYNTIKYVPLCAIANLCLATLVCIRNIKK